MSKTKHKPKWVTHYYAWPVKKSGPPILPPSYSNEGGSGDKRRIITPIFGTGFNGIPTYTLVDGLASGTEITFTQAVVTGFSITFDFYDSYIITEVTFVQSFAQPQGNWKWQGSNDGVGYTDIGGTFAITGATQVITTLSENTTSYRYYKMVGVSGSANNNPYIWQFDFKIGSRTTSTSGTLYTNPGGSGVRTFPVPTTSLNVLFGNINQLIDGTYNIGFAFDNVSVVGKYIQFDFQTPKLVDECAWWQHRAFSIGDWKWQGSDDAGTWTDIGNTFTLGAGIQTAGNQFLQVQRELRSNTKAYRYYRLLGMSGNATSSSYIIEVEFRIK